MAKCPHCGRNLREHERYCDFCEEDITDVVEKTVKIKKTVKKAVKKVKKQIPKIWAYCVKCKKKVIVKDPKNYLMKNNRHAIKGTCPHCSTKVFRIVGMNKK